MSWLGFADRWVNLIMRCVKSVSYSFLINKQIQGSIIPSMGIKQGDPLPPIFLLSMHIVFEELNHFSRSELQVAAQLFLIYSLQMTV